jgi:phage terminase large subunit GpA-like protein
MQRFLLELRPPDVADVADWADRYRVLDRRSASLAGRWQTERAPYLREPMRWLSSSDPCRVVVLKWSAQLGKTEILLNWIGYTVHCAPAPILAVQPTVDLTQSWSKDRLAPMISLSEPLRERVGLRTRAGRGRDGGDTIMAKSFPGGAIYCAGANSPIGLIGRPIGRVALDEVDGYPLSAGAYGDPVKLAERRAANFADAKILKTSTPTVRGLSRIERAYDESDKCVYHVPCPGCGEALVLRLEIMRWPAGRPLECYCVCPGCGREIQDREKYAMLAAGEWRPTATPRDPGVRGAWLNSWYSPFIQGGWGTIAREFVEATDCGDPEALKVVVNMLLGEEWDATQGAELDESDLLERREQFAADLPGVGMITAGVDVQGDRLEVEVVGWGLRYESWSLDYVVIPGDPTGDDVWSDLEEVFGRRYAGLAISAACVDSGFEADHVYRYVRPRWHRRIWATKGASDAQRVGREVWPVAWGRSANREVKFKLVGVSTAKGHVYRWLRAGPDEPGYCHFPEGRPRWWFEQLTAERPVKKYRRGHGYVEWELPKGRRNEALDCRVLAYAALLGLERAGRTIERELDRRKDERARPRKSTRRRRKDERLDAARRPRHDGGRGEDFIPRRDDW